MCGASRGTSTRQARYLYNEVFIAYLLIISFAEKEISIKNYKSMEQLHKLLNFTHIHFECANVFLFSEFPVVTHYHDSLIKICSGSLWEGT